MRSWLGLGVFLRYSESACRPELSREVRLGSRPVSSGRLDRHRGATVVQRMSEAWGQHGRGFNRLGPRGRIGAEFVVRAPADGYR